MSGENSVLRLCDAHVLYLQSFHSKPVQLDDGVQPGGHFWAHPDAVTRGNRGRHDEHQVSEHCDGNTYRELQQGKSLFGFERTVCFSNFLVHLMLTLKVCYCKIHPNIAFTQALSYFQ